MTALDLKIKEKKRELLNVFHYSKRQSQMNNRKTTADKLNNSEAAFLFG